MEKSKGKGQEKMNERLLLIINRLLEKNNHSKISSINEDMVLRKDFGFDSLDLAELTVQIESEFGIDIFEDGMVMSVDDIIQKLK